MSQFKSEIITKRIEPAEAVELWDEMQGLEAEIERLQAENKRLQRVLGEVENISKLHWTRDRIDLFTAELTIKLIGRRVRDE